MNRRANQVPGTVSRTRKQSRAAWLLAALFALLLPSAGVAESTRGITVSTLKYGIRLTLLVPRRRYQVNALARVTIILTNVSHRPITLRTTPHNAGGPNPSVAVQDTPSTNAIVPIASSFEFRPFSKVTGERILPGHTVRVSRYVVVTGPLLIAFVDTLPPYRTSEVHTPVARLTLVPGTPLKLTIRGRSGARFLQVSPSHSAASDPLRFIQSLQCRQSHGYALRTEANWVAIPHRSIYPACRPILEWRVIAGYLNQPVAAIDYSTRPRAPARTPVPLKKPQG